jgi:hypothetical protein
MRAHVIENGKVINTIEVEDLSFMSNLVDANLGGTIGDTWDGERFATPAPDPSAVRAAIKAQIDELEQQSMMNRGVREFCMHGMEQQAAILAQAQGTTVDAILLSLPAYVKFKALDDQIAALRSQL